MVQEFALNARPLLVSYCRQIRLVSIFQIVENLMESMSVLCAITYKDTT